MTFVETFPAPVESLRSDVCSPSAAVAGADRSLTPARRGELELHLHTCDGAQRQVRIGFELIGAHDAPVVLLAGEISANRHLAANVLDPSVGWADSLLSAGRTLDPAHYRVLAVDHLGADGCLDAVIDTADQADAIAAVLTHLEIEQLQAFIGYSYGGLVGQQFAIRHRPAVRRLVVVSAAHRPHPYASAWRALRGEAVELDASRSVAAENGLSLLSHRTVEEFGRRFNAPPRLCGGRVRVAVEDYLDHAGDRFVALTPVTARPRPFESIDLHRVDPALIRVPTTVIAVEGDHLAPLANAVALVEALGLRGRLRVLRSAYGHDAFLKETDHIDALLAEALASHS